MSAIDCRTAAPNQRVSINKAEPSFVSFSNKQTNSTPGVILANKELKRGRYRFSAEIKCKSPDTVYLLVSKGSLNNRVNPIQLLPATKDYTEFSVDFVSDEPSRFFLCVFMQAPSSLDIEVSVKNAQLIDIDAEAVQPAKEPTATGRYVYTPHKKYGHNSFTANLIEDYGFETVESDEALASTLSEGKPVVVHGLPNRVIELAKKHPKQIHSVWHSTIRGTSLMHEVPQYLDFIKLAKDGVIKGYWLSTQDSRPDYLKEIRLPFTLQDVGFNNKAKVDVALPLGSPHSSICKDLFRVIYELLSNNISFIATEWHIESFRINELKSALKSSSEIIVYGGEHNPIDSSYYGSARVYLCPSITDTMPYSVVEAVSSGVPVVISDSVGWHSSFSSQDPKTYRVFNMGTIKAVTKLIDNRILRNKLYVAQVAALKKLEAKNKKHNTSLLDTELPLVEESISFDVSALDPTGLYEAIKQGTSACNKFGIESCRLVDKGSSLELMLKLSNSPKAELLKDSHQYISVMSRGNNKVFAWELDSLISVKEKIEGIDLSNRTVLAIDRKGWAFDNIANEIILRILDGNSVKLTYPELSLLANIANVNMVNSSVVLFWWGAFELLHRRIPKTPIMTMIYDHYSWRDRLSDLKYVATNSVSIGYGNPKLREEVLQSVGVNHTSFILKDGVSFDKFHTNYEKSKQLPHFVVGWAGNSKIQKTAGYNGADLKGYSIIKEAIASSNTHFEVELLALDVSESEPIAHENMLPSFYSKIDVLVCASESEGTPNTVFEALACGIPVITTDVGNVRDVVIDGMNGFIVDRSAKSIENAILKAKDTLFDAAMIRDSVYEFSWKIKSMPWKTAIKFLEKSNVA